jgi:hypothetical protein
MACASLCVESMPDQLSMRDYIVAYASSPCLGDALDGFIYAAN